MKKVIALVLVLLGVAGGAAAGLFLKPAPPAEERQADQSDAKDGKITDDGAPPDGVPEPSSYVKIGRQTIVPVVEEGETRALMLFELAVDVTAAENDRAFAMEPRLRDAFLRELFQMSHTGAFMTTFTDDRVIEELRQNLVRAAREHLGKAAVKDVLILDVMRQEIAAP